MEVIKIDKTHYDAYVNHHSNNYTDKVLEGAKFTLSYKNANDEKSL